MRLYQVSTGELFAPGNAYWDKYMITKKGTPRKKMSWGILKYLIYEMGVNITPSVTEVASCLNGFGAFNIGSQWATGVTADVAAQLLDKNINPSEFSDAVKKASIEEQHKARDRGTLLHGIFHDVTSGKRKESDLSEEEKAFLYSCRCALHNKIDCPPDSYQTEVMLKHNSTCGTADVVSTSCSIINDWKTVREFHPVRESEWGQLAAYLVAAQLRSGYITQIHQTTFEHKVYGPLEGDALDLYYQAFDTARRLMGVMLRIKLKNTKIVYPPTVKQKKKVDYESTTGIADVLYWEPEPTA